MRFITLAIVLCVYGCVPSLHSILTDQDVVFDPALVGTWKESAQDTDAWTFERAGEKGYRLVYTEDGKPGVFAVRLGKIDGHIFLDLFPEADPIDANDFYKAHLVGGHTFLRVHAIGPTLKMSAMDPEWIDRVLKSSPEAIKHERLDDDRVLLTAPTPELKAFILKHVNTQGAFGEPFELGRAQP